VVVVRIAHPAAQDAGRGVRGLPIAHCPWLSLVTSCHALSRCPSSVRTHIGAPRQLAPPVALAHGGRGLEEAAWW
jgi:hypothetical protein